MIKERVEFASFLKINHVINIFMIILRIARSCDTRILNFYIFLNEIGDLLFIEYVSRRQI